MKGNTLNEFISDLYYNPEKEIVCGGGRYIISGFSDETGKLYTLQVCTIEEDSKTLFAHTSKDRRECVTAFEEAKIFNGKTIYEAENDIEVLFG